ncbi:MAG: AMP-binding protein [Butyrivibrio sp.]|nr:AMP-binding protein [Butyrivibrio sp.]
MTPTLVKALESAGGMNLKVLQVTGEIAVDLYVDRYPMKNAYGPTEFSYLPFFFDMDKAYKNTPIGTPDENTQLVLLDEYGMKNEKEGIMCIRLPFFRGYLHDADRENVITIDGFTYFKTSDYMSVDDKGNYTILGRSDDMVKINGNRIEPAEVEFAVREVLHTDFAAVKAWERGGSRYLCAYHTTGKKINAAEMAKELSKRLPLYMIPSCYVALDNIPLNENGKVNKKVLPEPDESAFFAPYACTFQHSAFR